MGRRGDEGLADVAADVGADGDVLQVGVGRTQAAGDGDGLVEGGVDALGDRVDLVLEGDEVGVDEFGELAVLKNEAGDLRGDGVVLGEFLENFGVGGVAGLGFLDRLEAQAGAVGVVGLVEQGFAELLGAVVVEGAVDGVEGGFVDLLGEGVDAGLEALALAVEFVGVDEHAVVFEFGEDRDQGHFDGAVEGFERWFGGQLPAQGVVELEGDIGVLGRVGTGLGQGDLVETLLVLAGADQVLDGDVGPAQQGHGQRVHRVRRARGIEHIAGDHGVAGEGLFGGWQVARETHAGVAQDIEVELEVVADLGDGGVFEHRAQGGDDGGLIEVRRRLGRADRDVIALPGLDGHADAGELREHGADVGGLGVDGDHRGRLHPRDQGVEFPAGGDGVVVALGGADGLFGLLLEKRPKAQGLKSLGIQLGVRPGGRDRLGSGLAQHGLQVVLVAVEAEFAQDRHQLGEFEVVRAGGVQVERDRHIVAQADELFRQRQVGAGGQDVLAALALYLARLRGGHDRVERAVLGDELGGGLGADAVNAGHVVRRVAHQGEHVDHLGRRDAKLVAQRLVGDEHIGVDVVHLRRRRALAQQLLEVLVLADDADADVGVLRRIRAGDGGDDVVGLEALGPDHGHAEQFEDFEGPLDLGGEVLGRLAAGGFVVGVELGAEGAAVAADVEGHGQVGGVAVTLELGGVPPQQFEEHADEPEGHVGRLAGDGRGHPAPDGVVGPEELGVAVDDVEGFHGGEEKRGWGSGIGQDRVVSGPGFPGRGRGGARPRVWRGWML